MRGYSGPNVTEHDIERVTEVLRSGQLTQGSIATDLEETIASMVGVKYCVLFNSGTSALFSAYRALGSSRIMLSSNTFCATANMGQVLGAELHFADIDKTMNIDLNAVENFPGDLVVPVHFAGMPVSMKNLNSIRQKLHFKVVEDAAHAFGSFYDTGEKVGCCKYSDITCFSFHAIKNITTGEGGACTTNSKKLAYKLRLLQSHGRTNGSCISEGFNLRMSDIQAALGLSQLSYYHKRKLRVQSLVDLYMHSLPPEITSETYRKPGINWHLFVIHHPRSVLVIQKLAEAGWYTTKHYKPVYLEPHYQILGYQSGLCPRAEEHYSTCVSLPLRKDMDMADAAEIVDIVKECL